MPHLHHMLIDTHCHIADRAFDADRAATIDRAVAAGVGQMIVACCDETEYADIARLCSQYPGCLYPTIGLHPENMGPDPDEQLDVLQHALETALSASAGPAPVAIGEIGLDLHWDASRLDDQRRILKRQLGWCSRYDLPAILHVRDAMTELLDLLHDAAPAGLRGVLHCYSGTADQYVAACRYGTFYIGVGGTSTYKKSLVPDVLRALPRDLLLERLLLETDSPYLAPVPQRGHRCEPAHTALTALHVADLLDLTPDTLAEITTANARRLFGL